MSEVTEYAQSVVRQWEEHDKFRREPTDVDFEIGGIDRDVAIAKELLLAQAEVATLKQQLANALPKANALDKLEARLLSTGKGVEVWGEGGAFGIYEARTARFVSNGKTLTQAIEGAE